MSLTGFRIRFANNVNASNVVRKLLFAIVVFMSSGPSSFGQAGGFLPGYNGTFYGSVLSAATGIARPFLLTQGYGTMAGVTVADSSLTYAGIRHNIHQVYVNPEPSYYVSSSEYLSYGITGFSYMWPTRIPHILFKDADTSFTANSDCVGYLTRLLSAIGDTTYGHNAYLNIIKTTHDSNKVPFAFRGFVATAYSFAVAFPTMPVAADSGWIYVAGNVQAAVIDTYNHTLRATLDTYNGVRKGGFGLAKPGDILAFGYSPASSSNGHVMVMEASPRFLTTDSLPGYFSPAKLPLANSILVNHNIYCVPVYDCSGQQAHYRDSRARVSGIGHGMLLIMTSKADDAPEGYIFDSSNSTGSTFHFDTLDSHAYAISVGRFVTPNTVPVFSNGSSQGFSICHDAPAFNISGLLTVSDTSAGQTETWTVLSAPAHGTLNGFSATASSGSSTITPAGLTYTPAAGFSGVDAFVIKVSDGVAMATTAVSVSVNATPVGTITGPSTVVVGANITLTDAASGGTWSASNGNATVTAGLVHGVSAGTVSVSYTVTDGCGTASATKLVTVGTSTVTVAPITGYYFYLCSGATAPYFDATTGGAWSVSPASAGVASVSATGVVAGLSAGTALLSYTVGTSYATAVVTVYPLPAVITGTGTVCQGSTTALTDATPGGVWSSGIPATATVGTGGVVSAINVGTVPVYYKISGTGCRASLIVTINANPAAITGPVKVCTGASIILSDATAGGIWSGTNSYAIVGSTGIVNGVAAGSVRVTYTSATGCFKVSTITVNQGAAPISGALTVCTGLKTFLSDAVTPGLSWTSSSTAVATVTASGAVTGVATGTSLITYTLANACTATAIVTVNPTPAVTAILGPSSVSHGGSGINLSDLTGGGVWTSSNIAILTVGSATGHVTAIASAGSANINYIVINGFSCSNFATKVISASPAPHGHGGGSATESVTGLIAEAASLAVTVSPNPNRGVFTISGTTGSANDAALSLVVTNMLGQVVYSGISTAKAGAINEQLTLGSNLANGFYLLNVYTDTAYSAYHFVIRK